MADPVPVEVEELEGETVMCPLCRDEEVRLKTTQGGVLQCFCAVQRSPVFLNEPARLDAELLPDEIIGDEENEDSDLEQDSPWQDDSADSDTEPHPWEPDPEGWCKWCGKPIMPSDVSENAQGEMEADHDCEEMQLGYKKAHIYDEMLDEPPRSENQENEQGV